MHIFLISTLLIQVVSVELHTQPQNWTTNESILWSAPWETPQCTSHHAVILELWFLGHNHDLPLIICDYFWQQLRGFFMPLFKVLVHMTFLLFVSQHMGHKFCRNVTHVQILFQNALNCCKWNFQHVSNFKDSESFVLKNTFLKLICIFICTTQSFHNSLTCEMSLICTSTFFIVTELQHFESRLPSKCECLVFCDKGKCSGTY